MLCKSKVHNSREIANLFKDGEEQTVAHGSSEVIFMPCKGPVVFVLTKFSSTLS